MIRICVTGPDGAGKTSLIAALSTQLEADLGPSAVAQVQIWDALQSLIDRKTAQRYLATIGPRSRALLLLHAISRALELAEQTGARVLLLDGYWYKYAVSELEQGAPTDLFQACATSFPAPDLTLHLDVPVHVARSRKSAAMTAYEQGFSAAPDAFERFQHALRDRWAALEQQVGPWTHLDASQPQEAVLAAALEALAPLLGVR